MPPVTNGASENIRPKDILGAGDDATAYGSPNVLRSAASSTCGQRRRPGLPSQLLNIAKLLCEVGSHEVSQLCTATEPEGSLNHEAEQAVWWL